MRDYITQIQRKENLSHDKITLVIHPMRDGVKGGQYLSGTGPDGPLAGAPAPRGPATR